MYWFIRNIPVMDNRETLDSTLYQNCVDKINRIKQFLSRAANSFAESFPPSPGTTNKFYTGKSSAMNNPRNEDVSWYALLLVVPLSLLGLMLGMTHHVLLFLAAMAENVLRSLCLQWTTFKDSQPKPEQYVFFCLVSAPIMMVLASAWVALTACCHLNRLFLSTVPEDLNNFINSKLPVDRIDVMWIGSKSEAKREKSNKLYIYYLEI